MSAVRLAIALCVTVVSLTTLTAAAQPDTAAIEQAIRQLGDPSFAVRERASKRLWEAGAAAEPALRQVLQSGDAEIVRRARELLDKFDWGIYPDTPPAVLRQIERYRGDPTILGRVADALVELGKPGCFALAKLAGRVITPDDRRIIDRELPSALARTVPLMLLAGEVAGVEALVETLLAAEAECAAANYTALVLLRGRLDEAVARWEAEAKAYPSAHAAAVLVALYRAKGAAAAVRRHAAGHDELLNIVLWEQGDWAELARRPTARYGLDPVSALALQATYHRLAGDGPAAAAALAALRQTEGNYSNHAATGLHFNERPADALTLRTSRPDTFDSELLAAQLRYREALALIEKAIAADPKGDRTYQDLRRQQARLLAIAGETERAKQLFDQLAGELGEPTDFDRVTWLVQAEVRLGLKDAAREHAAGYLTKLERPTGDNIRAASRQVLWAAFPSSGGTALVWWEFLRQKFPHETGPAVMKRLGDLLDPPGAGAGLGGLAEALLGSQPDGKPAAAADARLALAAAYEAAGQLDAVRDQLAAAAERAGARPWLELGDGLFARRQFAAAADAYEKAWKADKARPLPLYLHGWSLAQSGRAAEGRALMDQAHTFMLGNISERTLLAIELSDRGLSDLARRERAFARQLGTARHWYVVDLYADQAREAVARQDFTRAANAYDHILSGVLDSGAIGVYELAWCLRFPALARAYRARAALTAGRLDEALAHARACPDLMPGCIDVALVLVPELDRRGRKADADALYARIAAPHDDLRKEYSKSARFHNDRAWLAACCRRDLDAALGNARKATDIEPHNASYRDTLAEVYFQRGDRAAALEQIGQALALDPKNVYYARQKRRIEAGDPTAPRPEAR